MESFKYLKCKYCKAYQYRKVSEKMWPYVGVDKGSVQGACIMCNCFEWDCFEYSLFYIFGKMLKTYLELLNYMHCYAKIQKCIVTRLW